MESMKVNIDIVVFNDLGLKGFNMIAQGSNGEFLRGRYVKSDLSFSPIMMESLGFIEGLK